MRGDIRAHGGEHAHAQREEASLGVERELGIGDGVARLLVGDECLRARRHPMHRTPDALRRDQQRGVFGIGRRLHAEAAADVIGDDAQALALEPEHADELVAQHGDALRAAAQDIAVLRRVVGRRRAARLHRGDDHTLVDQRDTRHVRRVAEGLVKRAPSLGLAAESKVYG